jgi:SEL1 protein
VPQEAADDFAAGEYESALLRYLRGAELGLELAQSNAAWMLAEGYGYQGERDAGGA